MPSPDLQTQTRVGHSAERLAYPSEYDEEDEQADEGCTEDVSACYAGEFALEFVPFLFCRVSYRTKLPQSIGRRAHGKLVLGQHFTRKTSLKRCRSRWRWRRKPGRARAARVQTSERSSLLNSEVIVVLTGLWQVMTRSPCSGFEDHYERRPTGSTAILPISNSPYNWSGTVGVAAAAIHPTVG